MNEGVECKDRYIECPCLPEWLTGVLPIGSFTTDDIMLCDGCKCLTPFKNTNVLIYTCILHISVGRIHWCATKYCEKEECVQKLRDKLKDRQALVEILPNHASIDSADTNDVLRRHTQTGSACEHCGTGEQTRCKFPVCSRCFQVRYCNAECQLADYPNHKLWCKQKALDMAAAKPTPIPDIVWCDCYDEEARRIHKRTSNTLCCAPKCDRAVDGHVTCVGFYITECTNNRGKTHFIPSLFCCDKCKKTWKQPVIIKGL